MMECREPQLFGTEEARHEALWKHVRGNAGLEPHLESCTACRELAASFGRLDRALRGDARILAVCPAAEDLAAFAGGDSRSDIDRHVGHCAACRDDVQWLRDSAPVVTINRRRWFGVAAGGIAAAGGAWFVLRPSNPYASVIDVPALDRADLLGTLSNPNHTWLLNASIEDYDAGRYDAAEAKSHRILAVSPADPSAALVAGMAAYRQKRTAEAARLIAASERMMPMTHYRCWASLQFALLTGDRAAIDRECRHIGNDPVYADRVQRIRALAKV